MDVDFQYQVIQKESAQMNQIVRKSSYKAQHILE